MDKQLQMLLGVAAVGAAGYLIWKQTQKPKSFANLMAMPLSDLGGGYKAECKGRNERLGTFQYEGKTMYWCCQPGYFTDNRPDKKCADIQAIAD